MFLLHLISRNFARKVCEMLPKIFIFFSKTFPYWTFPYWIFSYWTFPRKSSILTKRFLTKCFIILNVSSKNICCHKTFSSSRLDYTFSLVFLQNISLRSFLHRTFAITQNISCHTNNSWFVQYLEDTTEVKEAKQEFLGVFNQALNGFIKKVFIGKNIVCGNVFLMV